MTQTAVVALAIVLIAMVIYLATEHTGLRGEIHFYEGGTTVGDASGVDFELGAGSAGLSIAAARAAMDPSRPGEARVTYTLTATDNAEVFYANGAAVGAATGVNIESADTSRLTVGAVELADPARTGQRRVRYTLTPIDVADPAHFYAQGVNVGDATGVDIQSADTTLLTVGAVEAADPSRTGFERVTYTLTPVDQSPTYRLNGASPVTTTAGHSLNFLTPGGCISGAIGGDGQGGAMLTLRYVCSRGGVLDDWTGIMSTAFDESKAAGEQSRTLQFGTGRPRQTSSTATTDLFWNGSDIEVRTEGTYQIVAEAQLVFRDPGSYRDGGTCPANTARETSTAPATAPSPLATRAGWPAWYQGAALHDGSTAWPAGQPYCEGASTGHGVAGIPDKISDEELPNAGVEVWRPEFQGRLEIQTGAGRDVMLPDILVNDPGATTTRPYVAFDPYRARWTALAEFTSGDTIQATLYLFDSTLNTLDTGTRVQLEVMRLR